MTTIGSKSSTLPQVTVLPHPDRFPTLDPYIPKKMPQSPFSSPKKIHPSSEQTAANQKQSWHISMVPRHAPSLAGSKKSSRHTEKLSSKNSEASVASQSRIDLVNKQAEATKESQPINDLPTETTVESTKTTKNICSSTSTFTKFLWVLVIGAVLLTVAALLIIFLTRPTSTTSTTSTTTTRPTTIPVNRSNLIFNGDAETGPCENGSNITSPTGWNVNGTATQIAYNNTANIGQTFEMPGPSNRGNCYFYGQVTTSTTMWQSININNYADTSLIDAQVVKFNLSAWFGGYAEQNDTASISLAFTNQTNNLILHGNVIGNLLSADRNNLTAMFFRQIIGFVPAGARMVTVIVTMIRWSGVTLNCNVDNIALNLFL